jgi:poly(A) polymerase
MPAATRQFEAALEIVVKLRAAGYEAYFAGGCVRDLLLGREPNDFDVATSAEPDVVLGMFERTFAVGAQFGVVLVATDAGGGAIASGGAREELDGREYLVTEVATFRSDGAYSDGRHPDAVRYTTSAEEDVKRRDFTINGLLLDPSLLFPQGLKPASLVEQNVRAKARTLQDAERTSGAEAQAESGLALPGLKSRPTAPDSSPILLEGGDVRSAVIDFVSGVADLEAGVVRAIGRPEARFEEDRLRMLRAVRFAARFGFAIEEETKRAIKALAKRIDSVSRERVRDELTKMLTEGHARRAFELLDETGLLAEVLPEIARMKGVEQPPEYHPEGDVWVHTLGLLDQLESGCSATLAWGALLHDVGKPPTFRRAPDRIRFDGHVEVGVAMGEEICRRFRFSNEETRQIVALIQNHMRFAHADRMKASTLKRFFRLEGFEEHLALHKMDCMAASRNLDHWKFVQERWQAMPEETLRPKPLLTGRELIEVGYRPGVGFKEMLRAVEDAQLEGAIGSEDEALRLVRERFPLADG